MAILQNLNNLSQAELIALVAKLSAQPERKLSLKVSEKGAVSVYGMGRFPVTLYAEQWERLFAMQDQLKAFIAANRSVLKTKAEAALSA